MKKYAKALVASLLASACTLTLLPAGPVLADTPAQSTSATPMADALLAEFKNIQSPSFDQTKREDQAYIRSYTDQREAVIAKRRALGLQFADLYPDHAMAPNLLLFAAQATREPDKQLDIYRRIAIKYAGTDAAERAAGPIRLAESEGKPFELAFTDAITSKPVSMKDLKGKVVVIDFWATWCGPCIAEMPHMKDLYSKYKDKGVEFIGISLDEQGEGLTKLKEFVAKNEIPWPQYYQGNGWASEFSKSWGINSIPRLFIIDKAGNLHSTNARGQLETLIPKLLDQKQPA